MEQLERSESSSSEESDCKNPVSVAHKNTQNGYAIFGNCLKGTRCANADEHSPEARARTGAWLQTKLDEIPKTDSRGPVKILSRDSRKTN